MREPLRGYQSQFRPAPVSHSMKPPSSRCGQPLHTLPGWIYSPLEGLTSVDNKIIAQETSLLYVYKHRRQYKTVCTYSHEAVVKYFTGNQGEQI